MESGQYEKKSLKLFNNLKNIDWKSLAKDCVCFANAKGGCIDISIEDDSNLPPPGQKIDDKLVEQIRKRISELTVNVGINVIKVTAENNAEYIKIKIFPSQNTVASTTDGHYYIRISDNCKPVLPDELARLFTDKPAYIWETKIVSKINLEECDKNKLEKFYSDIKSSERVSNFIKQKSNEELLEYYHLTDGNNLTNLGILWIGTQKQRANLLYAPIIQFIKYDNKGNKIKKITWDDFSLNPKELIEDIWEKIPEWQEGVEISEGIWGRKIIFNYNENVIRELLANALVHRPYTTRGDIFINLYHDRLEIHNPGLLPIGVTPQNILHQSVRRNEHLSKIFYDLNLMEREGSGFDKIYEVLLSEGKNPPIVEERDDRVVVTIFNIIKNEDIILLIDKLKKNYNISQKEVICFGIIAQNQSISASEFNKLIQSKDDKQIKNWLGNLLNEKIILTKGKTKGTIYIVNPDILKGTFFEKTDLSNIEEHRLKSLIIEDLEKYPNSSVSEIQKRIGKEIKIKRIRKCIYKLVEENKLKATGVKRYRKYSIAPKYG